MPNEEVISLRTELDNRDFDSNFDKLIRKGDAVDQLFEDMGSDVDSFGRKLRGLDTDISVDVDLALSNLSTIQSDITGIADEPVNIDLDLQNLTAVETAITGKGEA